MIRSQRFLCNSMWSFIILFHREGELTVCVIPAQFFLKSFGAVPSVDVIIVLIIMLYLYPTSSINVVKRDPSSFHCVGNVVLSWPCSMAHKEILLFVAVSFFEGFFVCFCCRGISSFLSFPLFNYTSNAYQVCCYLLLPAVQVLPLHKHLFLKNIVVFNIGIFSHLAAILKQTNDAGKARVRFFSTFPLFSSI